MLLPFPSEGFGESRSKVTACARQMQWMSFTQILEPFSAFRHALWLLWEEMQGAP